MNDRTSNRPTDEHDPGPLLTVKRRRAPATRRPQLVLLSGDASCLAFTQKRGWHLIQALPAWALDEAEQQLVDDEDRLARQDGARS